MPSDSLHVGRLERFEQVTAESPDAKDYYGVEGEKDAFEVCPIFRPRLGISALTESPHANVVSPSSYAFVDLHEPDKEEEVCHKANGRT